MMNRIITVILLLLTSCGMGKKGDGISHRPKEPESRTYILSEWNKVSDVEHIPAVRQIEHGADGRVRSFVINSILVDPRNINTFNATWRGPGMLVGNALINYNPNHTVCLKFVIDDPDTGLIQYSLVLERFGDDLWGLETIGHGSQKTIMQLTFTRINH